MKFYECERYIMKWKTNIYAYCYLRIHIIRFLYLFCHLKNSFFSVIMRLLMIFIAELFILWKSVHREVLDMKLSNIVN